MMEQRYDGTRLGAILKEQGRTQRWLAAKVGVSESLMSKIIGGDRTLTPPMAARITDILGVPDIFLRVVLPIGSDSISEREEAA